MPGFHERPHVAEKAGPALVLDDFLKVAGEILGQSFGAWCPIGNNRPQEFSILPSLIPERSMRRLNYLKYASGQLTQIKLPSEVGTGDDRLSLFIGNPPCYCGQPTNNFLKAKSTK